MTAQYCSSHAVITNLYNIQAGHTVSYTMHTYVYVCVCVCVYYTPTHDIIIQLIILSCNNTLNMYVWADTHNTSCHHNT